MTTDAPASATSSAIREDAALRTMRERRRRVWRNVLAVVVVTAGIGVLTILNRDAAAIRSCRKRMEFAALRFQELRDKGLPSEPVLPLPEDVDGAAESRKRIMELRDHVHYNVFYADRATFTREVGVCCCLRPHSRLFRSSGRHVIILDVDRGVHSVVWMDEAEFARRAEQLGLRVPGYD